MAPSARKHLFGTAVFGELIDPVTFFHGDAPKSVVVDE